MPTGAPLPSAKAEVRQMRPHLDGVACEHLRQYRGHADDLPLVNVAAAHPAGERQRDGGCAAPRGTAPEPLDCLRGRRDARAPRAPQSNVPHPRSVYDPGQVAGLQDSR